MGWGDFFFQQKKTGSQQGSCLLAEGEGFKPPIPERGIPDFESSAIDHSANLPQNVVQS